MTEIKKILLVDDDVELCMTLKDILLEKGYFVETINYGYLAFIEMKNKDYDVVLMDIDLAGIDGVKTYKEIKKIKPNMKVVLVTGHRQEEVGDLIREGIEGGMIEEYLRKPVNPDRLISIIEKYSLR